MQKTTRTIYSPSIFVVASTVLRPDALTEFAQIEAPAALAKDDSPISRIIDMAEENQSGFGLAPFTDLELGPEFAGRFCYHSWNKGRSTDAYHANIMEERHGSILEHSTISFAITGVSRGLTHELIRHRVGVAISQESQRYVDAKDIKFVMPPLNIHYYGTDNMEAVEWEEAQMEGVRDYEKWQTFLKHSIATDDSLSDEQARVMKKRANEAARGSLPNSCETKLTWTANIRTLRHFIETRGARPADLEIRRLAVELAKVCKKEAPTLFADIVINEPEAEDFGVPYVTSDWRKV